MAEITVYHNGQCSKCRGALELLQEKNIPHTVRWYMADALSAEELDGLLVKLKMKAHELLRTGEELYKTEYAGKTLDDEDWKKILIAQPELMQRPIVVKGDKAIIARPPEKVLSIL
ncbi:MAG: arsenate reductase (glutaredoxin) [Bacteroidetes bacterium 46-16]|nr:MAG: arsenate reductase (glutaredoxin) [Bacteroidetes bacterium 46-16]